MSGLSLALPWALAMLPLPVLAWMVLPPRSERGAVRVPASILAQLRAAGGAGPAQRQRPTGLFLRAIGWTALVIAVAGPFTAQPALLKPSGRDVVVALDLSASMAETDISWSGKRQHA